MWNDKAKKRLVGFHDSFMTKVFEDDIERTQFMLRIIMNNDKIKVKKAFTQKRIKNLQGRDVQLDILAEKANGEKFNVEVQNESGGAIPQRARYHMGVLDAQSLPKGKYFDKLPENYVIFITKNDVLQGNLPIYHIHRTIDENGQSFVDGSHIIYVNNRIQDDTPLGRLMHDFCCKNPDDMHYKELADKTRYFKENEKGVEQMGEVMERLIAKREQEAVERTTKKMGEVMEKLIAKREQEAVKKASKKLEAKAAKAAKAERINLAKEMLADNEGMDKIVKYTKLSLKEVLALAAKKSA